MNDSRDVDSIFWAAIEIERETDRAAYLDSVCGDDTQLRDRVDKLLRAHAGAGAFMVDQNASENTLEKRPVSKGPGTCVGPYKLLQELGEGGMGVVYLAEQTHPIRRRVAVKVIKQGMDTRQFIARFEAERQALALMDHPNIAHVLDAGCTDTGRPYFVMELVKGIPITRFCDENQLTTGERLGLFVSVCHAVQHAHQKGIIHRDLKPSNILVALYDDRPVPKIIDFGVAKATNQQLTDKTLFTEVGQIVGTWEYMSPEQAVLNQLDVDTRTDIYSMGVILYELLTGVTPLDSSSLRRAALEETLRLIREEEPPKPSTRVSSLGQSATAAATYRGTNASTLAKTLRGDLDWITMRALEKNRSRRYETANALAADLTRYLAGEPIEARPPSTAYRLRKAAARHRVALVTTSLIALTLLAATVTSSWLAAYALSQSRQARAQEQTAEQMATAARLEADRANRTTKMLAAALYEKGIKDVLINDPAQATETLRMANEAGYSPSHVLVLEGLLALNGGDNDGAVQRANKARDKDPDNVAARALLSVAYVWSGQDDLGELELQDLRDLEPTSAADRLLMAYAFMSADPHKAKQLLDSSEGIRRSPLGLLVGGFLKLFDAWEHKDAMLADQAIRDFEYVQFLFNDNQASRGFRLLALAAGIRFARAEGQEEVAKRYEQDGRLVAQELAKVANYPAGDWSRQQFYLTIGEADEAWDAIRGVGRHPGSYSWFLAAHCLERYGADALYEFDKAISREHRDSKYVRLARAYLLLESPDNASQVEGLVADMLDDKSPFFRRHTLLPLCIFGEHNKVRDHAMAEPKVVQGLWNDAVCLSYMAGKTSEMQLLEQAGEDYIALANAYFTIAMLRLADGNEAEAIEYFEKCVATNATGFFDCEWARAYLSRMKSGAIDK